MLPNSTNSLKRDISQVDSPAHHPLPSKPRLSPSITQESDTQLLAYPPWSSGSTRKPPPFQQPFPLLSFSYTPSERRLIWDDSSMRYFRDPPARADLGYAYDRWVKKEDEKGRLDSLLGAWERARGADAPQTLGGIKCEAPTGKKQKGVGSAKELQAGVITWRGVMTKILTAPYEEREGWELNVMCVNGILYLEEDLSKEQLQKKNVMEPRHRLQSYYGYSFESYCTTDSPPDAPQPDASPPNAQDPPGWGGDVDTNAQWCSVVKTKLGDTRVVIGGEVDCVRGTYDGGTDKLVELKTSMVIRGPHDEVKFEKKLLKFYFQSFLLGVPEIFVGFRTPSGRLQTTQIFRTIKIPGLVRGKLHAWDPAICLTWGDTFLEFLKNLTKPDKLIEDEPEPSTSSSGESSTHPKTASHGKIEKSPFVLMEERKNFLTALVDRYRAPIADVSKRVWRVRFVPRQGVECHLLTPEDVKDVEGGDNTGVERVGFLPKWFWDREVDAAANELLLREEEKAGRLTRGGTGGGKGMKGKVNHPMPGDKERGITISGWQI